jgi:hypothetical protein
LSWESAEIFNRELKSQKENTFAQQGAIPTPSLGIELTRLNSTYFPNLSNQLAISTRSARYYGLG